jgi:hypothetical protein
MSIPKNRKLLLVLFSGVFFGIMYFVLLIAEDGFVEKNETTQEYPYQRRILECQPKKTTCGEID